MCQRWASSRTVNLRCAATAGSGLRYSTGPRAARLYDEDGRAYLDFFTGASALNYGHNNPALKQALLDYLASDRVIHSLDMHTVAKSEFLTAFDEFILQPRGLDYRVQFPGPGRDERGRGRAQAGPQGHRPH